MKKVLIILCLFLFGLKASAEILELEPVATKDFWKRDGIYEEKVLEVGEKIINANNLKNRVVLRVIRNSKVINAYASFMQKSVNIYTGILPYCDNDDELAAIISHEIAHCLDYYDGGIPKWLLMMQVNIKEYEYKADLVGIDLMAKAGYNPIAAITMSNKVLDESFFDDFFFWTHPIGSKRTLAEYKYIYKKYPWALNTEMVKNVNYQNFVNYSQNDINKFIQKEKNKSNSWSSDL